MASLSTQTQEPRRERCLARVLGARMSDEQRVTPGRCSGSRWPSWPLCLCALLLALMSATSAEATQYSASGTIGPVRTHTLVYGVSALQDVSVFKCHPAWETDAAGCTYPRQMLILWQCSSPQRSVVNP